MLSFIKAQAKLYFENKALIVLITSIFVLNFLIVLFSVSFSARFLITEDRLTYVLEGSMQYQEVKTKLTYIESKHLVAKSFLTTEQGYIVAINEGAIPATKGRKINPNAETPEIIVGLLNDESGSLEIGQLIDVLGVQCLVVGVNEFVEGWEINSAVLDKTTKIHSVQMEATDIKVIKKLGKRLRSSFENWQINAPQAISAKEIFANTYIKLIIVWVAIISAASIFLLCDFYFTANAKFAKILYRLGGMPFSINFAKYLFLISYVFVVAIVGILLYLILDATFINKLLLSYGNYSLNIVDYLMTAMFWLASQCLVILFFPRERIKD